MIEVDLNYNCKCMIAAREKELLKWSKIIPATVNGPLTVPSPWKEGGRPIRKQNPETNIFSISADRGEIQRVRKIM